DGIRDFHVTGVQTCALPICMESVEELCEHIALIHNSEMILEGRLSDIKKAHKNNIYEVGLSMEGQGESLIKGLAGKFNILSFAQEPGSGHIHFKVQLPSDHTAELLMELLPLGNVNHFEETVPSANDIFIQTVKTKDHGK